MATKLDKTIKRELEIDGQAYMIAISPEGLKITQKGHRKGNEVSWKSSFRSWPSVWSDSPPIGSRCGEKS